MRQPTGSPIASCPYTLPGQEGVGVGVELTPVPEPCVVLLAERVKVFCADDVVVTAELVARWTFTAIQPAGR